MKITYFQDTDTLYLGFAEKVFRGGRVWGVGCGVLPILRGSIT
ncbi:hypothetical protein MiTe_02775 [Microcystis aeruginosa NIES-2520]|jgi:hypothetical protein|uniref:Uncharacterized protein n=1 Tax=Microcystis aeruginosa NIES-2520 TaxID=2303982 RepID=A0A5A5RLR7_MICAE|nr:hypothetical protein MiTe_02775 [Microcystis aeruginosa NIES-2520]